MVEVVVLLEEGDAGILGLLQPLSLGSGGKLLAVLASGRHAEHQEVLVNGLLRLLLHLLPELGRDLVDLGESV